MTTLADRRCKPCEGGVLPLTAPQAKELMSGLSSDWVINENATEISREFVFAGFSRTMGFVNATAWVATIEGHHPEFTVGYGYCRIRYWTHAINGLSDNDFICAAKIDRIAADS